MDYYGPGVGWRTWDRLLEYGALGYGPLVRRRGERRNGISEVLVASPEGARFVEERREEYAARYPAVAEAAGRTPVADDGSGSLA